jgi:predicted ATPase
VYAHLGGGQKVRLHRCIGARKEAGYGERVGEIAGELALHFERGRDYGRAVRYRQLAAEQALHRSGQRETLMHCEKGLALLSHLSATPERAHQELALRLCLSAVLATMHGYAAPVLEQNLQRAQALCQGLEATAEAASILVRLTRLHMVRADRAATEVLMAHEEHLLERLHDTAALVQLHTQLGTAEVCRAAYARAQEHYRHALRLYDVATHQALTLAFDGDPAAVALGVSGWCYWLTGRPAQAWDQAAQALALVETVAHPYTLCFALFYAAHVRQFRGEHDAAWVLVQRLVSLARAQGFVQPEVWGVLTEGCVLVQRDELVPGVERLTTGLAQYRAIGGQILLPFFMAGLAEAALRQGQVADGLHTVAEALRLTATNFDCFWEAELHRLRGELLLTPTGPEPQAQTSETAEAERCFQQALDIARRQEAKALELRAAMSLSRLWQAQRKPGAAHTLLAGAYGWFTEGFDTADLQAARELLEALQAAR